MEKNNQAPSTFKVIIIHGNGGSTPHDNWIPYIKAELEKLGVKVQAPQFPDAMIARSSSWLPFIKNNLGTTDATIIVGHSSGAVAALRYAEENKIFGSILIGVCYTDLDNENEKLSGYYDAPWQWDTIKKNQQWTVIFASPSDPWIPITEPRFIQKQLNSDYYEMKGQGHFGGDYHKETFPELLAVLKTKLNIT